MMRWVAAQKTGMGLVVGVGVWPRGVCVKCSHELEGVWRLQHCTSHYSVLMKGSGCRLGSTGGARESVCGCIEALTGVMIETEGALPTPPTPSCEPRGHINISSASQSVLFCAAQH